MAVAISTTRRDGDGIVRTMPLVIAVNGALAPAFAVELLRVATGQAALFGAQRLQGHARRADRHSFIPTDRDGRLRLHYSPA